MKKILSLILCGVLVLGITGCGNNETTTDKNNDNSNNNVQENNNETNNEQSKETYDKIIHCDIEAGVAGSLVSESEGSYYEYYIRDGELVKYIRFKVLPSEWDEEYIKEYIKYEYDQGWKNIKRNGRNVVVTVESDNDVPEDNNPLNVAVYEVEERPNKDSNCYIK